MSNYQFETKGFRRCINFSRRGNIYTDIKIVFASRRAAMSKIGQCSAVLRKSPAAGALAIEVRWP
jgi:hypothetical protein